MKPTSFRLGVLLQNGCLVVGRVRVPYGRNVLVDSVDTRPFVDVTLICGYTLDLLRLADSLDIGLFPNRPQQRSPSAVDL